MRGINKVILVGNSGKETEFKTLQDRTSVEIEILMKTGPFFGYLGDVDISRSFKRSRWADANCL